ncbi:MAG: hypothetical protein EBS53_14750, partial [Bacteroidetes bacterium]|nr:hypothetical protein [Bacteroidota bacterium]
MKGGWKDKAGAWNDEVYYPGIGHYGIAEIPLDNFDLTAPLITL